MGESEKDQQFRETEEKCRQNRELEREGFPVSGNGTPNGELPVQKWSMQKRVAGIFNTPRMAMINIAGVPDYAEPGVIVLCQAILGGIAVGVVMGKMKVIGPYATQIMSQVSSMMVGSVIFAGVLVFLFWAIRAAIVRALCKGESNWQFQSAAAVTGYAMMPILLMSILSMIILSAVLPVVVIDTSNLAAVQAVTAAFRAQTTSLKLSMTVPLTLVGNAWQAYLGGHGVKAGTGGKCSFGVGFAVFFVIGFIDLLFIFM